MCIETFYIVYQTLKKTQYKRDASLYDENEMLLYIRKSVMKRRVLAFDEKRAWKSHASISQKII